MFMLRGSHTFTRAINFGSLRSIRWELDCKVHLCASISPSSPNWNSLSTIPRESWWNLFSILIFKKRFASCKMDSKWEIIESSEYPNFDICGWQCLTIKLVIDSSSTSEQMTEWKNKGHAKNMICHHKCFCEDSCHKMFFSFWFYVIDFRPGYW